MKKIICALFAGLALNAFAAGPTTEPSTGKELATKKTATTTWNLDADAKRKAAMSPEELAWEKVLEDNLGSFYLPLYKRDKLAGKITAWDFLKDDPKLPRVLLIGDSVSRGYTLATRQAMAGKANVHRAPENCGPTRNGLKKLDVWIGDGKWDVIHFNFGIHNRRDKPADYVRDLEQIVERLKKTGAKIVWASTTPTPPDTKDYPAGVIEKLNEEAAKVMQKNGVAIDDLYSAIQPKLSEFQNPNDVHFKEPGYQFLGQQVAKSLLEVLK